MRLAVLTSGRQDWGILRSTCRALASDPRFELFLFVGGMHCSSAYGQTERLLVEEGLRIAERLDWMAGNEDSISRQAGQTVAFVSQALRRTPVDALILVGDRFETASAAFAATLETTPIVHFHGGEETEGAFDNALRHAVTKLSHLHLVSHPTHARRVIAIGEDPKTVHVVGAPGLDNLRRDDLPDRKELEAFLGLSLVEPIVVVTQHPTTLGDDPAVEGAALAAALDLVQATYVVTLPNSDPGGAFIRQEMIKAGRKPRRCVVEALGERRYWGLLRLADAMVGNSSSALIEAPAVGLPAVNVGDRQRGRERASNIIDCSSEARSIADALTRALTPEFRQRARTGGSPFGDGRSWERIVELLAAWVPPHPPRKTAVPLRQ